MASSFHLLVAIPGKEPLSFSLSGETVTLGRSPVNDIQILVREVSTSHCEFHKTGAGYEITDPGSTNGTKINDRPVKNLKVPLNNHDMILLGETVPAYIVVAEQGDLIDIKAEIAQIEKSRAVPKRPTVQHLTPPGADKKAVLPTKKPLEAIPVAVATPVSPTPVAGTNIGSATIKLDDVRPQTGPPLQKLAPPGSATAPPAAALTPGNQPPPVKLASPGPPPTKLPSLQPPGNQPPPVKLASPGPPPTKLPSLQPPGGQPLSVKPAAPVPPPATRPSLQPPVKLATPPSLKPPGVPTNPAPPAQTGGGPPKLSLPPKKVAPKLNLPEKED